MSYAQSNPAIADREMRSAARAMVSAAARHALIGAVTRMVAWLAERRQIRRNAAVLGSLSDRTLKDIGIQRHEIPYVARHGRDADRWS